MTVTKQKVKILGTGPSAGVEVSQTVPAGATWNLAAVSLALVQAGAGSSQPILTIDDGTDIVFQSPGASGAQAISTTCRYNWAAGLTPSAIIGSGANCFAFAPLPDGLLLPAGWRIRTVTIGLSANTGYGVPAFLVTQQGV